MSWYKVNVVNLLQEFITDIFNTGLNCLNFDRVMRHTARFQSMRFSQEKYTQSTKYYASQTS